MRYLVISIFIFSLLLLNGCSSKNQWLKADGSNYGLDIDHRDCKDHASWVLDVGSDEKPAYDYHCSGYADMTRGYGVASANCTPVQRYPALEVTAAKTFTKALLHNKEYESCMKSKGWLKKASIDNEKDMESKINENINVDSRLDETSIKCPIEYDIIHNLLNNNPVLLDEKNNKYTNLRVYKDDNLDFYLVVSRQINDYKVKIDGTFVDFSTDNFYAKKALKEIMDIVEKRLDKDIFNIVELHDRPLYGAYYRVLDENDNKIKFDGVYTIDNDCIYTYKIERIKKDLEDFGLTGLEKKMQEIYNYLNTVTPKQNYTSRNERSVFNHGCNEKKEWKLAQQKDTVEGYKTYISICNPASYISEAVNRIKTLEGKENTIYTCNDDYSLWLNVLQTNTIEGYKYYISECEPAENKNSALRKIEDLEGKPSLCDNKERDKMIWANALKTNTIEGYRYYIKKCNPSIYATEAQKRINNLLN